jgi:uncharacterized protein (DUF488 family)
MAARYIATIGYEAASVPRFLDTLTKARIGLLVDIRAVASSRRPGFAKSALAANLATAGIDYLHLRDLGTPAEGRQAARRGDHATLRRVFLKHLKTTAAQDALDALEELVKGKRRLALLCLEADPTYCHRSIVIEALERHLPLKVDHLFVTPG